MIAFLRPRTTPDWPRPISLIVQRESGLDRPPSTAVPGTLQNLLVLCSWQSPNLNDEFLIAAKDSAAMAQ
jgi:hypothetical protein